MVIACVAYVVYNIFYGCLFDNLLSNIYVRPFVQSTKLPDSLD